VRPTEVGSCRSVRRVGHIDRIGQLPSILRRVGPTQVARITLVTSVEKTAADDRLEVRNTGDPDGVPKRQCPLVRERVVWRIEKGKSAHVGHRIFAGADEVRKDRESMATWPRNWYNPRHLEAVHE